MKDDQGPPASFLPPPPEMAGTPVDAPLDSSSAEFRALNKIYDPTKAIAKVNYSHDAMIDLIIANPGVNQGELAKVFGYTEGWVSQVMASDAFKERLTVRKKELVDPAIVASIEERFQAVAMLSLERLKERLEKAAAPSMETILSGAELAAKALGYGARPDPRAVQVAVQTVVHVPAKSQSTEDWLNTRTVAVAGGK